MLGVRRLTPGVDPMKDRDHPDPAEPSCYCDLWEKSPRMLEEQGVPRGYCGLCTVCGKPGHLRHFPGAFPFTGAWCDKHYRRILLFDPRGTIGCLLCLAGLGRELGGAFALWKPS